MEALFVVSPLAVTPFNRRSIELDTFIVPLLIEQRRKEIGHTDEDRTFLAAVEDVLDIGTFWLDSDLVEKLPVDGDRRILSRLIEVSSPIHHVKFIVYFDDCPVFSLLRKQLKLNLLAGELVDQEHVVE
ncbi:hypothetical protein D3C86_1771080 [compost metagenome]